MLPAKRYYRTSNFISLTYVPDSHIIPNCQVVCIERMMNDNQTLCTFTKSHNPILCAAHRDYSISFAGGQIMKKLALLILIFGIPSVAAREVSTRVCLANGYTPLPLADPNIPHIYRDIMVGTRLTIIIDSNVAENWSGGRLTIEDANMDYGVLSARDYNDSPPAPDWEGSRFPAAGTGARVYTYEQMGVYGFQLLGHNSAVAGDWFIIDYNATSVGICNVGFYDHNISLDKPIYLVFFHVRTRDFNNDTKVDFSDFALFASYWLAPDCNDPNWCEGTDLNTDSNVDFHDFAMFADYWLETTEYTFRPPDFDKDRKVDFIDFAILTSYWQVTNCRNPDWCQGADLNTDRNVDIHDLRLFADYWLERTE